MPESNILTQSEPAAPSRDFDPFTISVFDLVNDPTPQGPSDPSDNPLPFEGCPVEDRLDMLATGWFNEQQLRSIRNLIISTATFFRRRFALDYRVNVSDPAAYAGGSDTVEDPVYRLALNVLSEPPHLQRKTTKGSPRLSSGAGNRQAAYYYLVKALFPSGKTARWPLGDEPPVEGSELDLLKAARDHLSAEIEARSPVPEKYEPFGRRLRRAVLGDDTAEPQATVTDAPSVFPRVSYVSTGQSTADNAELRVYPRSYFADQEAAAQAQAAAAQAQAAAAQAQAAATQRLVARADTIGCPSVGVSTHYVGSAELSYRAPDNPFIRR